MWAVYWHSWLVMREVLLDKVMYVEFLPLQPPAPLHKAVLRGCSADLWPQQETAPPFMSLRTASIYQASAGSFDLQQHVTWSYLSEVDFGSIVANTACVNLHVWVSFFFFFFYWSVLLVIFLWLQSSTVNTSPFIGPKVSREVWFTVRAAALFSNQRDHLTV